MDERKQPDAKRPDEELPGTDFAEQEGGGDVRENAGWQRAVITGRTGREPDLEASREAPSRGGRSSVSGRDPRR